jgi:cell division protein FtsI (penicillin-binding protein 3)
MMIKRQQQQFRRILSLLTLVVLAFVGLGFRLVDLQVLRHDELSRLAQDNTEHEYWESPRRGNILDVHGNLLATSVSVRTVCADPSMLGNEQATVARALAPLLQMSEYDLYRKLFPRVFRNDKGEMVTNGWRYVRLKRDVSEDNWAKIQRTMSHLSFGVNQEKMSRADRDFFYDLRHYAIFSEPDQMRFYPNGALAAQVLGYATSEQYKIDDDLVTQIVGRDGIELSMNSVLSGVAGWRVTETDSKHHELVALRDQDVQPRDGLNVVLTIDSVIQSIVESALADAMREHNPISITGLVIRPQTGEILAMATLPNFDPNNPGAALPASRRDRIITDVMEPGSTFKIVTVSGALNDGIVTLNDEFNCENGHFAYAGRVLHDAEPHGILTTEGILTKSSNIGAAKIGIRLGANELYNYAWNYGFGQRTGIPLPGEVPGILHPVKDWSKDSIVQIPMGQGVAVTRLQMALAMCAIANGGRLMQPMLVSELTGHDGEVVQQYSPVCVRRVISEATAKKMVTALKTVVTPEGTAPEAAMKDYVVAGKTGTAQKVGPHGYESGKYFASFIGFFPADNPQLCIAIVMDQPKEGYYGGQVCGPVFREIAERCASYLNIPPDITPPPSNSSPTNEGTARQMASIR